LNAEELTIKPKLGLGVPNASPKFHDILDSKVKPPLAGNIATAGLETMHAGALVDGP
jgi:hypothetical protein